MMPSPNEERMKPSTWKPQLKGSTPKQGPGSEYTSSIRLGQEPRPTFFFPFTFVSREGGRGERQTGQVTLPRVRESEKVAAKFYYSDAVKNVPMKALFLSGLDQVSFSPSPA
jgi:hypothetical protein